MNLIELPAETLAKFWVKMYVKSPARTAVISLVIAIVSATSAFYLDKISKENQELQRLQNLNYETQIQQLNQTETNIKQLLQFVESQKTTLRNTEDTIFSLKSEQEKLRPLVESDRSVVDAIFRAQEERNNANIWRERWIGFGLGIAASLFASSIWFVISLLMKNRNNKALNSEAL